MECKAIFNKEITKSRRIEYFDILRVIAMLAVILNHTSGHFSIELYNQYKNTRIWQLDNIVLSVTRFDVPIFFMLSGALLLNDDKNISLKYLFNKRLPRIIVPFIVWDIIYIIIYHFKFNLNIRDEFINSLFCPRDYAGHLWYLYTLIALYLITPILRCFIKQANETIINYTLLAWIIISICIPFIQPFIPQMQIADYYNLNFLSGYLGYFIIGYVLFNSKRSFSKVLLICCFILGWVTTAIGNYYYQTWSQGLNRRFLDFTSPSVVVMSVALFLLVKELFKEYTLSAKLKYVVYNISNLSFGMYLVHYVIRNFGVYFFDSHQIRPIVYVIISPIYVFSLSYIITFILSKIKYLSFCFTGNQYK